MTIKKTIQFLEYLGFNLIECKNYSLLLQNEKFKTEHELFFLDPETLLVKHHSEDELREWAIKSLEWTEKLIIVKEGNI